MSSNLTGSESPVATSPTQAVTVNKVCTDEEEERLMRAKPPHSYAALIIHFKHEFFHFFKFSKISAKLYNLLYRMFPDHILKLVGWPQARL